MHWHVRGDLAIHSQTKQSVTVYSTTHRANNKDYAKGRIYADYLLASTSIDCSCLREHYDFYKTFNDTTVDLIGPGCVEEGDIVTYSIEAMVSHNINHEVGMDSYYWSYDASLVNEVLYYSGDSSSITFVAGAIPDTGASLNVTVGRKNKPLDYSSYSMQILQAISEPVFVSGYEPPHCLGISTGTTTDTLIVN